jgi:hypothetical protein
MFFNNFPFFCSIFHFEVILKLHWIQKDVSLGGLSQFLEKQIRLEEKK